MGHILAAGVAVGLRYASYHRIITKSPRITSCRPQVKSYSGHNGSSSEGYVDTRSPSAPPLAPRKFIWSDTSIVWLTSLIWGEIYVRGMTPLGLWNSTNVRLFYVKHTQTQQRQITETVTNVVGGFFGRGQESPGRPRGDRT